jgi:hypothetical protein
VVIPSGIELCRLSGIHQLLVQVFRELKRDASSEVPWCSWTGPITRSGKLAEIEAQNSGFHPRPNRF